MTKDEFLTEYKQALIATYDWAQHEPARLERFMQSVEQTIRGLANSWNYDSELATRIYCKQGRHGKVTLKWLRALPDTSPASAPASAPARQAAYDALRAEYEQEL